MKLKKEQAEAAARLAAEQKAADAAAKAAEAERLRIEQAKAEAAAKLAAE